MNERIRSMWFPLRRPARAGAGVCVVFAALCGLAACGAGDGADTAADAPADAREPADLIITGAAVYTLDPERPWAEALAIADGRILALGSTAEISAAYRGEVRELTGGMVLPGFHDAHAHPISGGVQMAQCNLDAAQTVAETLAAIEVCHRDSPDTESPEDDWLVGGGWNLGLFPDGNPGKDLLDDIVGERPVFLRGADGHSGWVSSAALARAGISADTADPPLGVIERDSDGEPSGTLRESAMNLVREHLPPITQEQRLQGALAALELANSLGITSIVAASVDRPNLEVWRRLERDQQLTARIVTSIRVAGSIGGEGAASAGLALLEPDSRGSGSLVRADAAKVFLDGVLEGETAALLEPYASRNGSGGHLGTLNQSWEALRDLVIRLDADGVQVHMHAIGDAAVRQGLDAVEAAREANGPSDNRHHICHLQLVHPDDYGRFGELGVLANFQALWAFPDAYITDINLPQVGQARVDRMYPIGAIERAGGTIVGGSDWNVSSMNPLDAIETAVTRQNPFGGDEGVLNAEQAVSLETMLAAYTRNAAYLMHQEDETGTLEPGKQADLVVLDANLFDIEPAAINQTRVLETYLGGRRVYPK